LWFEASQGKKFKQQGRHSVMPVTPATERYRKEDGSLRPTLGKNARPYLKNKQKRAGVWLEQLFEETNQQKAKALRQDGEKERPRAEEILPARWETPETLSEIKKHLDFCTWWKSLEHKSKAKQGDFRPANLQVHLQQTRSPPCRRRGEGRGEGEPQSGWWDRHVATCMCAGSHAVTRHQHVSCQLNF
jgi:hypothetical protein